MVVLRDWWEPVPGKRNEGMSVRSSAGIHRLGIGMFRQKTRVEPQRVARPETIAAGTRTQGAREPHRSSCVIATSLTGSSEHRPCD
jgi:hypothetical protein